MIISNRRGQGTLEALFVVMLLALLLFGAFELGRGVLLKHSLDVATEKAARMLALDPGYYSNAVQLIRNEVDANILGGSYGQDVTVRLYDANTLAQITPSDLDSAAFGYQFLVAAELPWTSHLPFMASSSRTLSVAHHGVVDRIQP